MTINDYWMTIEWLLNDYWMTIEWQLNDNWMTIEWQMNDNWMTYVVIYFVIPIIIPPRYGMSQKSQTIKLYLWKLIRAASLPFFTTLVAQTACISISQRAICPVSVCRWSRLKGSSESLAIARVPETSNVRPVQKDATCHPLRYFEKRSDHTPTE